MQFRWLIVPLAIGIVALLSNLPRDEFSSQFEEWKAQYQAPFLSGIQEYYRSKIFQHNLLKILAHNRNPDRTYDMGVNQFTIYTEKQFQQIYLTNYLISDVTSEPLIEDFSSSPDEIDWIAQGLVSSVKNQGQCNACYAFAAVGAVEGLAQQKDPQPTVLSRSSQQLIDCSLPDSKNFGCIGGKVEYALNYLKSTGLATEKQYPFKGVTQTCQKMKEPGFKISQTVTTTNSCSALAESLVQGPVAVLVNAVKWGTYKSGILNDCQDVSPNLTVLLVGMSKDYWHIKNQWGVTWGQNGYIRLARVPGRSTCAVCSSATRPTN